MQDLEYLLEVVSSLDKKLAQIKPQIHDSSASFLQISVINYLGKKASQSVPDLAKQHESSRQNIQVVVNELLTLGVLQKSLNPKRKNSALFSLSSVGQEVYKNYQENYQNFLTELSLHIDTKNIPKLIKELSKIQKHIKIPTI